ncbi:electron transporter [Methylobacterium durans]|uniref:electron transporter n=1 Tax=Methylobacterium durans TaxID=2202825 RepID=UPI002AFFC3CD|nr:electron transporter [Methylobacterium durans]MEA1832767.1 electron transporter [Methylobacterium durans]
MSAVAVAPPAGARAPLNLAFVEAGREHPTSLGAEIGGRPALLLPVDYTCGNVCDPMVSLSAAALQATGLRPGVDVRLILVGLDPRDGPAAARALLARDGAGNALGDGVRALVGDRAAIDRLTGALGYSLTTDREAEAIVHPAAALLLAPDGRLARVLSPLALNGRDLRLAIVEAGEGRIGDLTDRFTLLCYGFDAATGIYTPLVRRILMAAALLTLLAVAGGLLLLGRWSRRAAR